MKKQKAQETYLSNVFSYLRGRRIVVRDNPVNAVQMGVGHLIDQGFAVRPGNIDDTLRREGSPWIAQAVEIGEDSGFTRGLLHFVIEESPLSFLPFVKRNIPPTLVIVTARILPDGTCELMIQPFVSLSLKKAMINHDADHLAAPRVEAAVMAVINSYQQSGFLVEAGKWKSIAAQKDKECPAFPRKARALTNFR
ncbi:MAG: hypothetical protein FWG14_11520 [Peptococcaceae bacterium]|nr:hypothetical protein [Peptococcaceae bacterium]